MLYLNQNDIQTIGVDWRTLLNIIVDASATLVSHDFAQPIKQYLRYNDLTNRIIAMPAYVGGNVNMTGIKWIASFPNNLQKNLKRAHSITVLNNSETGEPVCFLNASMISSIRTAAVSGAVIDKYLERKNGKSDYSIGITGFGPIGQLHLDMVMGLMNDRISKVKIFDLTNIDQSTSSYFEDSRIEVCNTWEESYDQADIFITCTVSKNRYINRKPKEGSLHLNVSLRDYFPEISENVDQMVVDDWDEVCRENTDISVMHDQMGLRKEDTLSIEEVLCKDVLNEMKDSDVVMFNPMGMAVFDIATAQYYFDRARQTSVGTILE